MIIKKTKNGFTLIEILIASAIFVSIISIVLAVLGFSVNLQSRNSAIREASQTARFIIEAISRDVRLADSYYIDSNYPKVTIEKNGLSYSYSYEDKTIFYNEGIIHEPLNPQDVKITNVSFTGIDDSNKKVQSYLQIKMTFQSNLGKRDLDKKSQTIETTVATRAYLKGY
jgi:prepilin-type N-terminal cleavage/methylation domain-containing protein